MFMSRERPCVTCLSLSNNLFGCVIGRNGLRWAFNLISAMKKRLKIDSDGQKKTGLSDIHLLSWVRQHLLPLLPLTPTQRFPFVIQTYTMLHHVSGVSIFLLTMMMFSNLADVFIQLSGHEASPWILNPVARLSVFRLVQPIVCITHTITGVFNFICKGLVWMQAFIPAKQEEHLIVD